MSEWKKLEFIQCSESDGGKKKWKNLNTKVIQKQRKWINGIVGAFKSSSEM